MNHLSATSTTSRNSVHLPYSSTAASTSNNQYITATCLVYSKGVDTNVCKLMTPIISCSNNRIASSPLWRQRICSIITNNHNSTATTSSTCTCTAIFTFGTTSTPTVRYAGTARQTTISCTSSTYAISTTSSTTTTS